MPTTISFSSLNQALERALRYRRQLAVEAGHPPGNLDELITGVTFAPDAVRADGRPSWLHIGRVFDAVIAEMLEVYWQPATDRVQIDRPQDWSPVPPPTIAHQPLVWVHGMGFWATDAAYRYFYAGRAYTAREAEARINTAKSPDGWTWEEIDNGET